MEGFYIDLSDNIFIHKDFVEVVGLKIPKGITLSEWLEQYGFDNKDKVVRLQLSIWNGVKLEYTVIVLEKLKIDFAWQTISQLSMLFM
jgi:hypothetical protein